MLSRPFWTLLISGPPGRTQPSSRYALHSKPLGLPTVLVFCAMRHAPGVALPRVLCCAVRRDLPCAPRHVLYLSGAWFPCFHAWGCT